jgi:hypothetical protein
MAISSYFLASLLLSDLALTGVGRHAAPFAILTSQRQGDYMTLSNSARPI